MLKRSADLRMLPATACIGEPVMDIRGNPIGEVKDLVIDARAGCVAYVLLSFGAFIALGNKLFPVPWSALVYQSDDAGLMLNVDEGDLEHAPAFDRDHWPDLTDRSWGEEIHKYYKHRPYWEPDHPRPTEQTLNGMHVVRKR